VNVRGVCVLLLFVCHTLTVDGAVWLREAWGHRNSSEPAVWLLTLQRHYMALKHTKRKKNIQDSVGHLQQIQWRGYRKDPIILKWKIFLLKISHFLSKFLNGFLCILYTHERTCHHALICLYAGISNTVLSQKN